MKIGEQLQKQRKLHNLSQNELADKLNISRQSISKWENDDSLPSFSNVVAISELLDVSLDELIKGDERLMNKFENNNNEKMSKIGVITVFGIIISVICLNIVLFFKKDITRIIILPEMVAFLGMILHINWKNVDGRISKQAVVWGIIWLALYLLPVFYILIVAFASGVNAASTY